MKREGFFHISLLSLSLVGIMYFGNPFVSVVSGDEEKVASHEKVTEPTRVLMNSIAARMNNILDGILGGNFRYVAQEAGAIVDQSYQIVNTFFPSESKGNEWFKRAQIDPQDSKKIDKLKEEFDVYVKEIVSSALKVQKSANSYDTEQTFKSFTKMVENACFECHKKIRDKQIPVENR